MGTTKTYRGRTSMKKQTTCISCKKTFWSNAKKNRVTKEVETLDNICQDCKNVMKRRQQKQRNMEMGLGQTVRIIPSEFEKYVRFRELYIAEMERKKKEKEEANKNGS